jgi:hypothetical protein
MHRAQSIMLLIPLATGLVAGQQPAPPAAHDAQPSQTASANAEVAHAPVPIFEPEAEFPYEASNAGLSGKCMLATTVDINGNSQNPHVLSCTNFIFAKSSLEAVAKYRFKPASDRTGKSIAVTVNVEVNFRSVGHDTEPDILMPAQIRVGFGTPPGIVSGAPDANGVYPLVKGIDRPAFARFHDDGFLSASEHFHQGLACHIVLTIDAKGKASNPYVADCDSDTLTKPAVASLLKSQYRPAKLNGKPVSVRVAVKIASVGYNLKPQPTP